MIRCKRKCVEIFRQNIEKQPVSSWPAAKIFNLNGLGAKYSFQRAYALWLGVREGQAWRRAPLVPIQSSLNGVSRGRGRFGVENAPVLSLQADVATQVDQL